MLKLFTEDTGGNPPSFRTGKESYLFGKIDERLTRIALNYRRTIYTVQSDHLLIQILQHLDTLTDSNDDETFYRRLSYDGLKLCSSLDITSINNKQKHFRSNQFYPSPVKEYYINEVLGYPAGLDSKKHWNTFQPVRVISHPMTDMNINIRNGGGSTNVVQGKAIIAIDFGLLGIQYRRWREACSTMEVQPTIQQFVFQYPLVNMMYSDTVCCYINNYSAHLNLVDKINQKPNYSFNVPDISGNTSVESETKTMIDHVLGGKLNMVQIAKVLPVPYYPSVWNFVKLQQGLVNYQNLGYYFIGYLPYFYLLATLSHLTGSKDNLNYLYNIKRRMEQTINSGYLRGIPGVNVDDIKEEFKVKLIQYL